MEEKEPTLKEMNTTLDNLTSNLNDLTGFLQEHMVTHEDLERSQNKLKQEIFDAMDKKLAELKGELISFMRKLSKQLNELVFVLRNKQVLTEEEREHVLSFTPFPRSTQ